MRVTLCVDALEPNPGGIGRYTWHLCEGLVGRSDVEVQFFAHNRLIKDPSILLRGEKPLRRRRAFRKLGALWDKRALRGSLIHGPNYFLPPFANDGVITIHDLSVFKYPEAHPAGRVHAFNVQFQHSLDRARHIITDTETVRAELIAELNVPPTKITAVHLGVDDRFRKQRPDQLQDTMIRLGLRPGGYGLCVSTLEPRKKIGELLMAWRRLPRDMRSRYPLVLAGGSGWRNEHLRTAIQEGIAEGWLRHLGFVHEADLPALYAGAALFVYPSIYEGFGLPPLEAMASGTPVIVSRRSCLPEVSGDAANYFDPDDPDDFLTCITQSLLDDSWQAEASSRGLARASKFTWSQCVEQTVDVYRKAVG